jgi:choline dehydrogenase
MDRPNLTVLTAALVTRVTLEGKRATGVEIAYDGKSVRIGAGAEVVLSLGAIHTPKVLMQSGIGDASELQRLGIPTVQHLPGVGQNFQDHFGIACVWEYQRTLAPRNNGGEATFFWKSNPPLDTPDLQTCQIEVPFCSAETAARFNPPAASTSVVDAHLKVYGIDNLRVADGSIMPRVMTGNTMAACIIIGERAGQILQAEHRS